MTRVALTILLAISVPGANVIADESESELDTARSLWQSAQNGNYRYSYQKYCECYRSEPPTTVVTVNRGQIEDVFHLHDDSDRQVPAREGSYDLYWTVDDLFAKLEIAFEREAEVRVEYDSNFGFPTSLYIDYDPGFTGDETDLRLSGFERL